MANEQTIEQQVVNRQTELEQVKDPFVDLWKESTALGYPARNDWEGIAQTGRDKEYQVFDDSCIKALNIRADGISGYHVSPAITWFMSRSADKELRELDEVQGWLQECDEGIYYAYSRSNFYDASVIGSFLRDGDGIGLATMFIEDIEGEGKIGFMVPHPREVWLADDKFGYANLMHRKYKWTIHQVKSAFTDTEIKKLSEGVRTAISNNTNIAEKTEFIWAVWPNPDYVRGSLVQGRRKFNTYMVQVDGTNLIRTSSLDRFPPVWRVKKPSNLPYGRGLIGEALISVYTANSMASSMLGSAQMEADGLWMVPEGKRGEADLNPGGQNYYNDDRDEIRRIDTGSNKSFSVEMMDRVRQGVMDNFKVSFFMALTQAAMEGRTLTVPQVMEIQGEKAAAMGPDLGTLNTVLDIIHAQVFDIEMAAGRIPPPPQIVLDEMVRDEQTGTGGKARLIDVDYVGPLAQAQKRLFKTQGINQGIAALEPLVQLQIAAQQPVTALDRLKVEETVEEIFDAHGMPVKLMRTDDEVKEIQEIRAQAEQERRTAEMALEAAKVVPGLGKEIESGSPVAALTGGG
jgi:hypothetical protein